MAGITAQYNLAPVTTRIFSLNVLSPSGGSNLVDSAPQPLRNVRGRLDFFITSGDNGYESRFSVLGGYGEFMDDSTRNFGFINGTNENCTVTEVVLNQIRVTTPAGDAGGRVYDIIFNPRLSYGPTIEQTTVNTIGNNTLTVRIVKYDVFNI